MYMVTTLTLDELGKLIKDKRVSLDNGKLMFGRDAEVVDRYFKERVGYDGYVMGLRGHLSEGTAKLFAQLDSGVMHGDKIIIEAEVDQQDLIRCNLTDLAAASNAVFYGLDDADVIELLDQAQETARNGKTAEVLCVPYLKMEGHLRVTSLTEEGINFNVDGITFVKLKK